jgi:Tfp pilus assembly protein PilV
MSRGASAFTLVEAALSVSVFSIGMLGLAGAFSQLIKANGTAIQRERAVLLASSQLNRLRTAGLAEVGQLKGTFAEPFQDYSWQGQLHWPAAETKAGTLLLTVKHRSGTTVTLWTQIAMEGGC